MDEKSEIREQLSAALSNREINTPEKLQTELKKSGIDVRFTENRNGISEASFKKNDLTYKGQTIDHKWDDISKTLKENGASAEKIKNANPHRPKSFLAVHLKKEKEKSIYVKDISGKANITVPKFETKRAPLNTVTDRLKESKQEGPQPTGEEQKELDFAKYYNPRIEKAISEIKSELQNGNTAVNVPAIMEKNGFRTEQDRFIYSNDVTQMGVDKNRLEKPVRDLIQQKANFERYELKYNELMNREPVKVVFLDKLTGRAEAKEASNRSLQREQKAAVKPEFKPQVHGLENRDFLVHSKFEQREHEHKRQQELRQVFASARVQDQDKGISR